MKITIYGAARDVTGSCHLVETEKDPVLIDCGMFQGSEKLERLNYIPKSLHAHEVQAMVLTHGHLDHLTDSAKIQEEDTERENRKRVNIDCTLVDAGHILGSACVEMVAHTADGDRHLVFSGDSESEALNTVPGPCIILAGSGMCNAGRILHHLHGEAHAMDELAFDIEEKFAIIPEKPKLGDTIELNWEAVRA